VVACSAVAFSTAGLFTRLVHADVWTILVWRGLFGGLLIGGYVVWQQRKAALAAFRSMGWAGLTVAACSTGSTICFIHALRLTTVADATVIYATAPFIAAVVAWVWTRERPGWIRLAAAMLALVGMLVIVRTDLAAGHPLGNLLALVMTVLLAVMMVVIRVNRGTSMLPAVCLSALACACVALPFAHPVSISGWDFLLLVLFGTTQFGLGLLLLTVGSRLIPASQTALISNLDLPMAPFWVWLAFGDLPDPATWLGGAIIVLAVGMDLAAERLPAPKRVVCKAS
jgi:drug/metabolite transporter (DMT)-like permease